jgi:serine/threonine protein kinase/tetratricopeptide (TPR) repeat protein
MATLVPLSGPELPEDTPTLVPIPEQPSDAATMVPLPPDSDSPTLVDAPSPFPTAKPEAARPVSGPAGSKRPPSARPPSATPRPPSPPPRPQSSAPSTQAFYNPQPILTEGTILAGRYEIVRTLGEGGMGAVYQANDLELNRMVALKVIRPELAKNQAIIDRFKQELLLSQRVTHRNVIRIYDLGEGDGVKFITMEFIEGQDLRSLIFERKKFEPKEAVGIMEQVCLALDSAHMVGVIHRDLKPQNIMVDGSGRVLVMDFGLARTLEGDGMTQTGALVGTMEYMSPEQALAQDLDQRSDLFSAGLIFYELLTGQMPFRADSALASLIKRTQERAAPISSHGEGFPENLSKIVTKCLERDPANRYQTAKELLADLQAWEGKIAAGAVHFQSVKPWGQDIPWPKIGMAAAAIVLAVVGFVYRGKLFAPATAKKAVVVQPPSLAILPFYNASGDSQLDWLGPSLGDMLSTGVGQSSHLRAISPDRLQQVLHDLRIAPGTEIDAATLRRIAEFANADMVVSGKYTKQGDQIHIDATFQNLKKNSVPVPLQAQAQNQQDVSGAVDRLAEGIRQNLALSPDLVKELQAQSYRPTSKSADALRDYNQGVQLMRQANNLEALKRLQDAVKEDPEFALAYSKLGEVYSALGYDSEAEQASQRAMDLSQDLPLSAKYFIEASHARVTKDTARAIAAYENLEKSFPDNQDVLFALGHLYEDSGDLDKAREHYGDVLKADSKNVDALLAMGRVEIKASNPQAGLEPLGKAENLAVEVDNLEQQALILQAIGIAYQDLNKPTEALRNFNDSIEINQKLGQKRGVAASLSMIAQVDESLGKTDDALKSYNQALQIRRDIGAKKEVGDTLINIASLYYDRGLYDKALPMFKEALQIQRDAGDEANLAMCLNNIGSVYLAKGQSEDALTYFLQALQLREKQNVPADLAETLNNLGGAYVSLGQYDQAMTSYMRALDLDHKSNDNRGAAIVSMAMGEMFQAQGRMGPAVNALQDAVNGLRSAGEKGATMANALIALSDALARAGRGSEAGKYMDEARSIVPDLKSDRLNAALLNAEGDLKFYQDDVKGASDSYDQAARLATRISDTDLTLLSKLNQAKVAISENRGHAAIGDLKALAQKADQQGRRTIALEASVYLAEALLQDKNIAAARAELDRALARSEKLGLLLLQARIHYLLGTAQRASGSTAESNAQLKSALNLLDRIQKEPGAEHISDRSDLKSMFAAATQIAQKN